jgi:AmmeMemoRadiSam system protein A
MMDQNQQGELLRIARAAILDELRNSKRPVQPRVPLPEDSAGAFVTIRNAKRLRGCMGTFAPKSTLATTIESVARSAARDPRFAPDPLTVDELKDTRLEISILSPLAPLSGVETLRVGTHGVLVRRGDATGCFLPHVAVEHGWSADEFLDQCCTAKAGIPKGAWKGPDCTVFTFTANVFGD